MTASLTKASEIHLIWPG